MKWAQVSNYFLFTTQFSSFNEYFLNHNNLKKNKGFLEALVKEISSLDKGYTRGKNIIKLSWIA